MFESYKQILSDVQPIGVTGRVSGVRGLTMSVEDFPAPMGAACRIDHSGHYISARVIGFTSESTLVMPMGQIAGIRKGDKVTFTSAEQTLGVGDQMLGRVLDGRGRAIDGLGPLHTDSRTPIWPGPISPMSRRRISEPLSVGIAAIDGMLTVGRGQRMGIFAGSGVGKSVLLGQISRFSSAEVVVIGLIGERGREVRDFIECNLGPDGLSKSVVVVSTSDEPPLLRVQGAAVACAVAEYFRDCGRDVLLLIDSLTRLATAQRQIGLAAGEPPATKGYTPSVFNLLPELLERSGRTEAGSITGFYTVGVESDDPTEPISEAVRSVTDGHICLSRELSNSGHYPAIAITQSVSRVMNDVIDEEHIAAVETVNKLIASYDKIEDVVNVGAYKASTSIDGDLAVRAMPAVREFLTQPVSEHAEWDKTKSNLLELARQIDRWREEILQSRPSQNRQGE